MRPNAARRLLQPNHSASTNRSIVRTPTPLVWETALAIPPGGKDRYGNPTSSRSYPITTVAPFAQDTGHAGARLAGRASSGGAMPCGTAPAEVSRARGQGAFARPAPSVAIARDGSFAPTRSARTPRVASSLRRWLERPAPRTRTLKRRPCPSRTRRARPLSLASPDYPLARGPVGDP
jgi:hypothetical protein